MCCLASTHLNHNHRYNNTTKIRPGSRGLMQRYLPAQLRVAKAELAQALQQHGSCPSFVLKWFRGDAVNSCMLMV